MRNIPSDLVEFIEKARQAQPSAEVARMALVSMDLTALNDDDTPDKIAALVAKADQGNLGHVAATCVYPQFLRQTFNATASKGINRATVINFPSGKGTLEQTVRDTKAAIASGANEIDIVLDYQSFLAGDTKTAEKLLRACRETCGPDIKMKVILESSEFERYQDLYDACLLALDGGADFLKTSTGKKEKGASLEAAATMLQAILDTSRETGLKISGYVKTVADAAQYVALTENIMGGNWIALDTFRIGASGLLTDVLKHLGKAPAPAASKTPVSSY